MAKMLGGSTHGYLMPAHQADATLSQVNPVSGTAYAALATTKNVRVIYAAAKVTWTVQPSPLEDDITIDGQTLTFAKANPASDTWYEARQFGPTLAGGGLIPIAATLDSFILEGRSVKVEAETTGGTTSNLSVRVKYAKW